MLRAAHLPAVFPERLAAEWGHDEYGTFQSFAVDNVVQRMRWIPPGSFLMGSPDNEVGRFDNEAQHVVELTQGIWLGNTPVTQALWDAVMGTNPSQFKNPQCPVESVCWDDCQEFLCRLNQRVEGLDARLPTEAEWEYACRAGTTTATWVGDLTWVQDLQKGEDAQGPLLDSIAWYFENTQGNMHPATVAQKQPNPWGIYDILGNVYEWCADWLAPYDDVKMVRDPQGPPMGTDRVLRGGSWLSGVRYVRAAYRYKHSPEYRHVNVGFRIARGR